MSTLFSSNAYSYSRQMQNYQNNSRTSVEQVDMYKFQIMYSKVLNNLKNDIANIMLCNYKNDLIQLTAEQLTTFFSIDDLMDEPKPRDLLVQIVNKIHLLKVIANIPIELVENDNSNLDKRLSNLSKTLRLIIEIIDSK